MSKNILAAAPLQFFAFDNNAYCDFSISAAKAVAGKDILLAIYSMDGSEV